VIIVDVATSEVPLPVAGSQVHSDISHDRTSRHHLSDMSRANTMFIDNRISDTLSEHSMPLLHHRTPSNHLRQVRQDDDAGDGDTCSITSVKSFTSESHSAEGSRSSRLSDVPGVSSVLTTNTVLTSHASPQAAGDGPHVSASHRSKRPTSPRYKLQSARVSGLVKRKKMERHN